MRLIKQLTVVAAFLAVLGVSDVSEALNPFEGGRSVRAKFYNPFAASQRFAAAGGFNRLRSTNPFVDLEPVTAPAVTASSAPPVAAAVTGAVPVTLAPSSASGSGSFAIGAVSRPPFQPPVRSPFRPAPRPPLIP
ncbi:MAG: hypothetical protein ACRCT8_05800 [Lacipirellulaceae bacterium]